MRGLTNRRTVMSILALGVGTAAFRMSRRRNLNGNIRRQMMQPIRRIF
ncbi:MAG: DUF3918 family protein [Paenibacillus sp.]|nr:DUF3918 family protein [Paenibacillus sp.]